MVSMCFCNFRNGACGYFCQQVVRCIFQFNEFAYLFVHRMRFMQFEHKFAWFTASYAGSLIFTVYILHITHILATTLFHVIHNRNKKIRFSV